MLRAVDRFRGCMPPELARASRFARSQLHAKGEDWQKRASLEGLWEGDRSRFDLVVRSLYIDRAVQLYARVHDELRSMFPRFDACSFIDGMEIGERRLVFDGTQHDLAAVRFVNRFGPLLHEGSGQLGESCRIIPSSDGDALTGRSRGLRVEVALDRPKIDQATWDRVAERLRHGRTPWVDATPRVPSGSSAIRLAKLTLPELVYLNWDEVRKPLGKVDQALFDAADHLDLERIDLALAAGADPNALDNDDTALCRLAYVRPTEHLDAADPAPDDEQLSAIRRRRIACMTRLVEAGALLDLAGRGGWTPLAGAISCNQDDALEWLLQRGADDTIQTDPEEYPGMWPTAWDLAESDVACAGSDEREPYEEKLRLLRSHRRSPDGAGPTAGPGAAPAYPTSDNLPS